MSDKRTEYRIAKAFYLLDMFGDEIQDRVHTTSGKDLDEIRGVWVAVRERWEEVCEEMERLLSG